MPEGIDIYSRYQTVTDWNAVRRADVTWCYQKVSDGNTLRVPQSNRNYSGVSQGGYHFSQPGSPVEQAKILLSQCEKYGLLDLNPCLDMEDNPPDSGKPNIPYLQKPDYVIAFGRWILSQGHGFTLYANNSDWKHLGPSVLSALPQTFRWVGRYGANPTVGWDAHQYTSSGSCPGVTASSLDRNRGKVPLNKKAVDMPLSEDDFKLLFYNTPIQEFGNFSQLLENVKNNAKASAALSTSITKLTDLVIADAANDITREQFNESLQGFFTATVAPLVREILHNTEFDVTARISPEDREALSIHMVDTLYGRLQS